MSQPDFDYRSFYTWDHDTNWVLTQPTPRVHGCAEPYEKPPEAFLADFKTLVDFMAMLGLNHLIIWGALRDCHGGADELRRLIEYGLANDVRVAPGVGLYCYGGVYYDGDHEFSLNRLLEERADLAAVAQDGQPMVRMGGNPRKCVACPRNEEVADWTLRSIRWLMEEVGPPAIHFETGDYGHCYCPACKKAGSRERGVNYSDMAIMLPPVVEEVRRHSADCWLSYNHYFGYTRKMMTEKPPFATAIPWDVICKWGVSWMLEPQLRPDNSRYKATIEPMTPDVRPPTETNMAHLHFGTGWWSCSPRGTLEITRFMKHIPVIHQVGFQGICTHGEESELNPPCELNFHVYAALADKADATPEEISNRSVGELLGSADLATEVLTAFRDVELSPTLSARVARAAEEAVGQTKVRLNWLTFELHRLSEESRKRKKG